MIKIGTYIVKNADLTPEECLIYTKEAGFERVCVGITRLLNNTVTPEIANKYGLELENVHLSGKGTNDIWVEGINGDAVTDRYCDEIRRCSELGVKTGIAHVTWGVPTPPPVSELGLSRYLRIAECAEKHDFNLALENSVSADHLRFLLDRIDSTHVGYCFDSGHNNCFTPQEKLLREYGHRLFAMHLQDNDGWRDLHMIPMDGCAPWAEIIEDLRKTALYDSSITFEVAGKISKKCPGQTEHEIAKDLERIKILNDKSLVKIQDGQFDIYSDLTYAEYLNRLFNAGKKIINNFI